jgi:hypothetical protein
MAPECTVWEHQSVSSLTGSEPVMQALLSSLHTRPVISALAREAPGRAASPTKALRDVEPVRIVIVTGAQ